MTELLTKDIRGLKGAPLSVLSLLLIAPQPVDKNWLSRESGYSDKMITLACAYLLEYGYAEQNSLGYFISRNFTLNTPERDYEKAPCFKPGTKASFRPLKKVKETKAERAKWAILLDVGINRNDLTLNLLKQEHVTLDYLEAKTLEYKAKGLSGTRWTGMLIRAIERNEPAAPRARNGHHKYCQCHSCDFDKGMGRRD